MAEYKLSYTASEIDERLGKVDSLVSSVNGISPDENGNVAIDIGTSITVDSKLSETSENPVQNKVIYETLTNMASDVSDGFDDTFAEIEALQNEIDNLSAGGGAGGGSNAIIDVGSLPTENINEDNFYRLVTGTFVYNQYLQTQWTCYCVDSLPEVGEAAFTGDLSDASSIIVTAYHNTTDNTTNVYLTEDLATQFGMSTGWCPIADVMALTGYAFNGVIYDISEDPKDSTFRLLLEYKTYFYDYKWNEVGAQSDYEQNDSSATDFIKNRPFYRNSVVKYEGEVITAANEYGANLYSVWEDYISDTGHVYDVTINGEVHKCQVKKFVTIDGTHAATYYYVGNIAIPATYTEFPEDVVIEDTGESFCMITVYGMTAFYTTEAGKYNIKIEDVLGLKQLDEKYIPDTIARVEDMPCYGDSVVLFDGDAEFKSTSTNNNISSFVALNEGTEFVTELSRNYEITLDGILYKCAMKSYTSGDTTVTYLGNFMKYISQVDGDFKDELAANNVTDTGEPFCIINVTDNALIYMTELGTHHFIIKDVGDLKQLDEKYIPDTIARVTDIVQPDWNQNDSSASDYIKNRPFYKETEVLFDGDVTTAMDDYGTITYSNSSVIVDLGVVQVGDIFDVMVDNVMYSCEYKSNKIPYIGNLYMYFEQAASSMGMTTEEFITTMAQNTPEITELAVDTKEPFILLLTDTSTDFCTREAGTYHFIINGVTNIKKLDSSMIDWAGGGAPSGLPEVTTDDNDKVLMVVDGKWTLGSIANGDEVAY